MKSALIVFATLVLGLIAGSVSALWLSGQFHSARAPLSALSVGGWQSDWSIGSKAANGYVRARVARHGLLALRKEEAVYFIKAQDDFGEPLIETCIYRVSGRDMPSDWWSITLYDEEGRLPMNEDERLSFDPSQLEAEADNWSFLVTATTPEDPDINWVSSQAGGDFELMLRLYKPGAALLEEPRQTLRTPTIERLSCVEETVS